MIRRIERESTAGMTLFAQTLAQTLTRILAVAVLALPGMERAYAGDAANREIIGFSPDGAYFAFEQYGVQDGSGFPYSDVFVLETASDTWVRGTPARVALRNDTASLDMARSTARRKIDPYLWRLKIGAENGRTLVSDRAANADDAARFLPFTLADEGATPGLGTVRLRLTEITMARADCAALGSENRGFALVLEDTAGRPLRILHEDTAIPASRGCPVHYGISDVIAYPRRGSGPILVVLVSLYSFGFEGLDRRFIAISSVFDNNPSASN